MENSLETSLEQKEYLKNIYFDPRNPLSFSGINKFWNGIKKEEKVTRAQLKNWLLEQDVYTSHFPAKRKFKRPKTVSPKPDFYWQADSAYMVRFKEKGFSFFVIFIDVFSRFVWSRPLKTLKSLEMVSVMHDIFSDAQPQKLYTDAGSEFVGKSVQSFLNSRNIEHYIARSETKAALAERAIKTIKKKLLLYMDEKNTNDWVEALQDVVYAYNNSYHRSIKMTPTEARNSNTADVWNNQFRQKLKRKKHVKKPTKEIEFKFNVNDTVKLLGINRKFTREYNETYTPETFIITERRKKGNISLYKVKDFNNDPIIGEFQDEELLKVNEPRDKIYKVQKVLKTRKRNGKTEYLVRWKNWPPKFDSWVDSFEKL